MNLQSRADDETMVLALYQQLIHGWNEGNAEAFAAPFAEDGDLIAFDGTHFRGRNEIISFHQPLFDKWLKGTRLVEHTLSVRFLNPDVALIHAHGGTIARGNNNPSPERDSIQTLVARKRDGTWQLAAFQNTRVRPMGGNARGTLIWLLFDYLWKVFVTAKWRTLWKHPRRFTQANQILKPLRSRRGDSGPGAS